MPLPEITFYVRQRSFSHELKRNTSLQVGRGSEVDIRVDDGSVSRRHAVLHYDGVQVEVEDLGSSNGTQILPGNRKENPVEVTEGRRYPLAPGDVVRVGNVSGLLQQPVSVLAMDRVTAPPPSSVGRILVQPTMKQLYELAARSAATDITVLVTGETGAGKELLAAHVHEKSPRAKGNFVQINCAAIAETLLESELFGHEKGAFTGANNRRVGLLESAAGGTVFLDEIGEMPLSTQAKLLRVLEERRIRRLGSSTKIPIDVRFVAATNRHLESEVAAGRFRGDLFYRISGLVLALPPLRERPLEIEPLARRFLQDFCLRSGIAAPEFTQSALLALQAYPWPGNVRELKNAMERAPFLSGGAPLTSAHIPTTQAAEELLDADEFEDERTDVGLVDQVLAVREAVRGARESRQSATSPRRPLSGPAPPTAYRMPNPPTEAEILGAPRRSTGRSSAPTRSDSGGLTHGNSKQYSAELERETIIGALEACSGNQTRAAEMLQVSRRTLINRIEALGLPRPRKRRRSSGS